MSGATLGQTLGIGRREAAVAVLSQVRPVDERELARVLTEARAAKTPLEVTGGGSKQRIGRPKIGRAHV